MRPRRPEPEGWDIAPCPPQLDPGEREALLAGQTVKHHARGAAGSAGASMFLSSAPAEAVWRVITDFAAYVDFLPYVTSSWVEGVEDVDPELRVHRWGMELTTKGVVTRYAVESRQRLRQGWMSWEMVPRGTSPMANARGSWLTAPWEGDPARTLLVYAVDVRTAWWLPGPLHKKAADRGLPAMVSLIGRRAERPGEGR